jgi:spore germination protein GerM
MPNSRSSDKISFGWIVGIGLALFTAGGAAAWWSVNHLSSSQKKTETPIESPTLAPISQSPIVEPISPSPVVASPTATPEVIPATEIKQVYWLKVTDTGSQLVTQEITVQKADSRDQELTAVLQTLLAGPINPNDTTTIPADTKLLGLKVDKTGIKVNLSQEFATDDGSDVLIGRLAQIIYTATSSDPNGKVWIEVEGKPLELLGEGHGIEIAQPMTRKFFEENYQL